MAHTRSKKQNGWNRLLGFGRVGRRKAWRWLQKQLGTVLIAGVSGAAGGALTVVIHNQRTQSTSSGQNPTIDRRTDCDFSNAILMNSTVTCGAGNADASMDHPSMNHVSAQDQVPEKIDEKSAPETTVYPTDKKINAKKE